jgi:mono/diheme cytochrome c family protein
VKIRILLVAVLTLAFLGLDSVGLSQTSGQTSYRDKCLICHGTNGLGNNQPGQPANVLPFNTPSIVAMSDATLLGILENGSGKMPAFKGKVTDDEANKLIQYIRQLQQAQ